MSGIRKVAVIGAGPAGRAFARRCAECGFTVALEDVMPSNLRRAQDEFAETDGSLLKGSLSFATTVEDAVRDADLAVDFVPDELESKLEIFSMLDRMAPPHTILCTPTTALSLTDLASCTYRAGLCVAVRSSGVGMLSGHAELVRSRFTSPQTEAAARAFLAEIGVAADVVEDIEEPMLVKNIGSITSGS